MSDHGNHNDSGSEGGLSEYEIKQNLAACLDNIQTTGSFALFEQKKFVPNPGLVIGDTPIGLPLSSNDASTVIAASHPAPFGRGTETVVDVEVRKTWELSAGEFRTANPDWHKYVRQIVKKIGEDMGLTAAGKKIEAQLYKLLLYVDGAMFKPHQDSEKAPGMFGTLVIALPSKHEGGEVHLTHGGRKKVFKTSECSEFYYSYMSWFSDVIHEIKPVTSGRRLVLTYNLIQATPGQVLSASGSSKDLNKLLAIFSWWQKHKDDDPEEIPKIVAYMLDYHYTEASLSFNSLKGKDLQVASHLKEAAAEKDMFFCLANVTKEITGDCDDNEYGYGNHYYDDEDEDSDDEEFHAINEEIDSEVSLVYVADLDGTELGRNMAFEETDIVQEDAFADLSPDSEDFEGHTGNEGAQATHFYHRTVALLMPRSHLIPFILQSTGDVALTKWLDSLDKTLTNKSESSEQTVEDLRETCRLVLKKTQETKRFTYRTYSDSVLSRIFKAIIDLEDKVLIAEAYLLFLDKLHLATFQFAGSVVTKLDLQELLSRASSVIAGIAFFSERWAIIDKILENCIPASASSSSQKELLDNWVLTETKKLIASATLSSTKDMEAVCKVLSRFQVQVVDLIQAAVNRKMKATPVVIAFLNTLIAEKASFPDTISTPLLTNIMSELVKTLDSTSISKFLQELSATSKMSEFSKLLCHCRSLNMISELDQLIGNLCDAATKVETPILDSLFLTFLWNMVIALQKHTAPIAGSPFRGLFQNILNTYIQRFVMHEPKADDGTRKEIVCTIRHCGFCVQINEFLRSPIAKQLRLRIPKEGDRAHIIRAISTRECYISNYYKSDNMCFRKIQATGPHAMWEKRYQTAKNKIQGLGSKKILEALLEECYDFITTLSAVRRIVPNALGRVQPASVMSGSASTIAGGSGRVQLASVSGNVSATASGSAVATKPPLPLLTVPYNVKNGSQQLLPSWFNSALANLRHAYPDDLFEGHMAYVCQDMKSKKNYAPLPPGELPAHFQRLHIEIVKCNDCRQNYATGPGDTLVSFGLHLGDRPHRDRVAARLGQNTARAGAPAIQGHASGSGSSSVANQVAPLPANRKRTSTMIDMTNDSD